MDKNDSLEKLKEYIERTKEVLELSSPLLEGIEDAERYRIHLQKSFQKIGELAQLNNDILDRYLFPLVSEDHVASDEDVEVLKEFSDLLNDPTNMIIFDHPLVYVPAKKLLQVAEESGDLKAQIVALDNLIIASYMMLNLTVRLYPENSICYKYRDEGLEAGRKILEYLTPDKFASLPDDECRELVLIDSRYIRCLFEWDDKEDRAPINEEDLRLMRQALAIAKDPFYLESMPDYRWDAHIFRTLQYLSDFTEYNNIHEFTPDQLKELYGYTEDLIDYLKANPELQEGCPEIEQRLYSLRNSHLAGKISRDEYLEGLTEQINGNDPNDFSARGMFTRLIAPVEFILCLDKDNITPAQQETLTKIYSTLPNYAYHMPKTGAVSFMVTFIADLLKYYINVPGLIPFKELCLGLMAALHPTTHIHTLNVADISLRLADHLMKEAPQLFIGIAGAETPDDVIAKRDEVLDFVYNSALMHDIGKIFIVETIYTYGRRLLDMEFETIRSHTLVGAALLSRFEETKDYAAAAMGHHRWFDGSNGYPEALDLSAEKYATVVSIIEVADCMDASTDSIGRSYKTGKSFDEFIDELMEGSGTRYAPYVTDLFTDFAVRKEFEIALPKLRDKNYRETYNTLKAL